MRLITATTPEENRVASCSTTVFCLLAKAVCRCCLFSTLPKMIPLLLPPLPPLFSSRFLLLPFLLWHALFHTIHAKKVSGDFKLTGAHTEHVLTTFAVVPTGAVLSLDVTAQFMYEDERLLGIYAVRDTEWPAFQKSQLCAPRTRWAQHHAALTLAYVNDQVWKTETPVFMSIGRRKSASSPDPPTRNHYWYIIVADCNLERGNLDAKVPPLHFELEIRNRLDTTGSRKDPDEDQEAATTTKKTSAAVDFNNPHAVYTQFSADEMSLYWYHGWTLLFAGGLAVWLWTCILQQQVVVVPTTPPSPPVHVTILWVTAAAMLDATSALLELMHLRWYEHNGIGSYAADALAAHAEALADALAALLLWCVGAGWTLSTELQQRALGGFGGPMVSRLYRDWRQPFGHLVGGRLVWGPGHVAMAIVLTGYVILAQWGRVYDDNFDSYHDYEHLPGRLLMWLRLTAGALFALCTWNTYQCLQQHAAGRSVSDFYKILLIFGVVWYTGLPALCTVARLLPYILRNGVVVIGSSALQTSVLAALAYLVTYSKALAKVNVSSQKKNHSEDVLPGTSGLGATAAAPRFFSLGAAKIRLD